MLDTSCSEWEARQTPLAQCTYWFSLLFTISSASDDFIHSERDMIHLDVSLDSLCLATNIAKLFAFVFVYFPAIMGPRTSFLSCLLDYTRSLAIVQAIQKQLNCPPPPSSESHQQGVYGPSVGMQGHPVPGACQIHCHA
jgi:hypothetical protein